MNKKSNLAINLRVSSQFVNFDQVNFEFSVYQDCHTGIPVYRKHGISPKFSAVLNRYLLKNIETPVLIQQKFWYFTNLPNYKSIIQNNIKCNKIVSCIGLRASNVVNIKYLNC